MDDCYYEERHRDVPFIENRSYEMVLPHRKTDKKWLLLKRRLLSTLSKAVKMVALLSLTKKKKKEMQLLNVFHRLSVQLNIFIVNEVKDV